jgi:hypothetical protein
MTTDPAFMDFEERKIQKLKMTINFKSECHASSLVLTANKKIEYGSGRIDDSLTQTLEFDIAESDGSPSTYPFNDSQTYEELNNKLEKGNIHYCKSSNLYSCKDKFKKMDDLAISIEYKGTKILSGKYTDTFKIKVNDKGFDGSKIGFGVVNGLKKVNSVIDPKNGVMYAYDNYNHDSEVGIIYQGQDKAYFQNSINGGEGKFPFYLNGGNSQNVRAGDTIIIIPNSNSTRIDSHYLGGWVVDTIDMTQSINDRKYTLPLMWNFTPSLNEPATRIENLAFVVGTNARKNECTDDVSTILIKAFNGDNELTGGAIYVNIEYGPYMVGNDIFIYAHFRMQKDDGINIIKKHSGDAIRYTLKGKGVNTILPVTLTNTESVAKLIKKDIQLTLDDLVYTEESQDTSTPADIDEFAQGVALKRVLVNSGEVEPSFSRSSCDGWTEVSAFLEPGEAITFIPDKQLFDYEYDYDENAP